MGKDSHTPTIAQLRELSQQLSEKIPYLKMLVLFGSRATGNTHVNSDWDFAILYDEDKFDTYKINHPLALFELPMILGKIFKINSDQIDIVEINRCSKLIAHFIANDGKVLYEHQAEEFEEFRQRVLLSKLDMKKIENTKQRNIDLFLQRWGV